MRRWLVLLMVAAACGGPASAPIVVSGDSAAASPAPTPVNAGTATPAEAHPPVAAAVPTWYLVTVTARLPDGFAAGLRRVPGVDAVSVVMAGNAHVVETRTTAGIVVDRAPAGYAYPVEVQAFKPDDHGRYVPSEVGARLAALGPGDIALGESSARLRGIGVGGTVRLQNGITLEVAAIIEDRWIGAAEIVTTRVYPVPFGADRERYALVRHTGDRVALEAAAAGLTEQPVRVVAAGETPLFRFADVVLPQVEIKLEFGEFAFRPATGRRIEIDPAWIDRHIVTTHIPLLGAVTCHERFAGSLLRVMTSLEAARLESLVDAGAFRGCWVPRFVTGRRDISHHSWGIAADINFGNGLSGSGSPVSPILLRLMQAAEIASGHTWSPADPGHFEWVGSR